MSTLKKTIMETSLSKPVQQASTVNKIVAWFSMKITSSPHLWKVNL